MLACAAAKAARSGALHLLHVLHHDRLGLLQLLGGAEHHDLGAGLVLDRDVAGRRVEGVAGPEDLLAIRVAKGEAARDDVAPVRALAAVVRQPLEHRGRIDVLAELDEAHRVAVDVRVPILHRTVVINLRALLRYLRHGCLLRTWLWALPTLSATTRGAQGSAAAVAHGRSFG